MSLTVSQSDKQDFEMLPEGDYIARCFKIIDLGTQTTEWKGTAKLQRKVLISWEILDDEIRMEDGRPFAVSKKYTATLDERGHLRKDLEAWRGKKFDLNELTNFYLPDVLGAYCRVQIVHNDATDGNTYANINAIMATKEKPAAVNPDVDFDVDVPNMEIFETFSDKLKEQIKDSLEWKAREEKANEVTPAPRPKPSEAFDTPEVRGDEEIDLNSIPF